MYRVITTLFILFGCACAQVSIEPNYATLYIFAPSAMNISCKGVGSTSNTVKLEWYKDGQEAGNLGFSVKNQIEITRNIQTEVVTLQKDTTGFNDAGNYRCQKGTENDQTLEVVVVKVNKVEAEYNKTLKAATLACNLVQDPSRTKDAVYEMHWEHDGSEVKSSDKYEIFPENGTLVIHEPERKDSGEYFCVYKFDKQEQRIPVSFKASPYVRHFDKSKNLIQGDPLTLRCNVYAYPKAEISWMKDGMKVDDIERITISTDEKTGLENGKLNIPSVEFEDKGDYTCTAFSVAYNKSDNSTIIVRVKDKLAALWPFLGIVAEVIVLCVIIFIYEKKRSKSEDEDEAADAGNCANSADHKDSEVRQRNVRA